MLMRIELRCALGIVVLLGIQFGCEKLGLDPSRKLACSPPPQRLCPAGFSCRDDDRCWRNGTFDGPIDSPAEDAHAETGSADEPRTDGKANADESGIGDAAVSEGPAADMTTGDAEDAASSDGKVDASVACGVCPSPPSNGHSTCSGTTCSIVCDDGYRNCSGTELCTRNSACCTDAECPKNMPACIGGQCKARASNDPCSSDAECGTGHCAATAAGAATKVCCDSDCSGSCNDGCAGGTCQHKAFRTACDEIDNSYYAPRYYLCDGNGNCNPPAFPCGGGDACAASNNVACCGDPTNNLQPACIAPTMCGQGAGNFEQSCNATIDCPLGTYCCFIQNPDLQITACAANCQIYAPAGFDSAAYAHGQACDYVRDSSCPNGQHCGAASSLGTSACGL
jgi:hypothetical protein